MSLKISGVSGIASGDKINNGVWVHLDLPGTDQETGQTIPAYLDPDTKRQPMRVLVRSYRCKAIKDAEAKMQKDGFVKVRVAKKNDKDKVIADYSILPERTRFGHLLASVDNFSPEAPGIQEVTPEDAMAVIFDDDSLDWIVQQVKEVAYDDSYYLTNAEITQEKEAAAAAGAPQPQKTVKSPAPETPSPT